MGEPKGVGRAHTAYPTLGAAGSFFDECLLASWWASTGESTWGSRPKMTISAAFHKQITHDKAGYRTKRGLSQNYASLSTLERGVNRLGSKDGHLRSGMGFSRPSCALRPKTHPLKHEVCLFGPVMGPSQVWSGLC